MTRALLLDFAPRPPRARALGRLALLAALGLAGYLVDGYGHSLEALARWEASARTMQRRQGAAPPALADPARRQQLQVDLKMANRAIAHLSLPWDRLFQEIEATVDERVTLLGVEPDAETGGLMISAEARGMNDMLDYARRVRASELFTAAHVQSHQIQLLDPQKPVRFILRVGWSGAVSAGGAVGVGAD
jgi:Tfp pilus assembly protein PilN